MLRPAAIALALSLAASFAAAGPQPVPPSPAAPLPNSATIPKVGFRAEYLRDLDDLQQKIEDLAAAMPQSKYAWRPEEGVRSVSEVYLHIAGSNYFLATFVGVKPPANLPDFDKITEKARVLDELRKSFDHIRNAAINTPDSDLETQIKMFGATTTKRAAFITILNHLHEHLGQSIAYARINGVVPPWSRKEQ